MFIVDIWNTLLYVPLVNLLVLFYHILGDNFGFAIIALTLVLKTLTYPLSIPSLKMAQKQREIQPELKKIKEKYKNKQVQAEKQMELFKKHGINPASGCLPQVITVIIFLTMYRVFNNLLVAETAGTSITQINEILYNFPFLQFQPGDVFNTQFLWMNLAYPDPYYILPVLAAVAQFFASRYSMRQNKKIAPVVKDTPDKSDDLMYNMQEQMAYLFPIMTLIFGVRLPSGLVLYWLVSTLFMVIQYYFIYRGKSVSLNTKEIKNEKESGTSN